MITTCNNSFLTSQIAFLIGFLKQNLMFLEESHSNSLFTLFHKSTDAVAIWMKTQADIEHAVL